MSTFGDMNFIAAANNSAMIVTTSMISSNVKAPCFFRIRT
jgi:hypothetical protein